jgi:uncharacterized membrane protein
MTPHLLDGPLGPRLHGAAVHFPIALTLCAGAFEVAAVLFAARPWARELDAAGRLTLVLAALGSLPAIASGLWLTRGEVAGHGTLRLHHLFVWPAFALLVALATWRAIVGHRATRASLAVHACGVLVCGALLAAAGFFGGEMTLTV